MDEFVVCINIVRQQNRPSKYNRNKNRNGAIKMRMYDVIMTHPNDERFINYGEQSVIDSRDVAKIIGREHKEVLAMIEGQKHRDGRVKHVGFLHAISESGLFDPADFFIESSYKTKGNNKTYKCYLLTKKGCDMIATRMTGAKGTLFAAKYIERFNEMEEQLKAQSQTTAVASYMVDNPIERAKLWIAEQEANMLLEIK